MGLRDDDRKEEPPPPVVVEKCNISLCYFDQQTTNNKTTTTRLSVDSDNNSNTSSFNSDNLSAVSSSSEFCFERRPSSERDALDSDDPAEDSNGYLEPFLHQVGGHGSVLTWDQRTVCKPFSAQEKMVYESLPVDFRNFVPDYRGITEIVMIKDNSGYLLFDFGNAAAATVESQNRSSCSNISLRKSESSNILCHKRRSVGRVRMKRSGSLELETYRRVPGRLSKSTKNTSYSARCSFDHKYNDVFNDFSTKRSSGSSLFNNEVDESKPNTASAHLFYHQNPWALECQTRQLTKMQRHPGKKQKFILLENLVRNFNFPCVLDLKMGFRQYGDDAPLAKRQAQTVKCKNSTSSSLGVRMCGMQVYHAISGTFKCYNKYYGRTLSVDGFRREMFKFWHNGVTFHSDLLPLCIERLEALKKIIMRAEGYRFYSSSLLIIYDGDVYTNMPKLSLPQHSAHPDFTTINSNCCYKKNNNSSLGGGGATTSTACKLDVRMIDFEHTSLPPPESSGGPSCHSTTGSSSSTTTTKILHTGYDDGYVQGIDNLIDILKSLPPNNQKDSDASSSYAFPA